MQWHTATMGWLSDPAMAWGALVMGNRIGDSQLGPIKRILMAYGPGIVSGIVSGLFVILSAGAVFVQETREDRIRSEARHAAIETQIAAESETRRMQIEAGRKTDEQLLASLQDQVRASTECRIALARLEAARNMR